MKVFTRAKQSRFSYFFSFLCFLCFPISLSATTVSGTIEKPDGTPVTGTIEFVLSQRATTTTPPVMVAPVKVTCAVTAGQIASGCKVLGNDILDPAGTFYRVRVLDTNNIVVFPSTPYTLSGSALDLGSLPVTAEETLQPPAGSVTGDMNVTGNLTVGGSATFGADPQDFFHLRLLGQTANPPTTGAGSLFYRSDLDRVRFRTGGLEVFDGTQYLPVSAPASETFEFGGNIRIPNQFAATFKRVNDIRLVDPNLWTEATVTEKIDAAIAEFGSNPGVVLLPTNLGSGDPTSTPTHISLLDLRTPGQLHVGDPRDPGGLTNGGVLEVNFNQDKIGDTTAFNAGLVVNAIGQTATGQPASANGLWMNCRHRFDSCIGMTQWGAQLNGFLMDVQPRDDTGAVINAVRLSTFDTAPSWFYWSRMLNIESGAANLAPEVEFQGDGTSRVNIWNGQIWLRKGDSNQRRAPVAPPANVTAAVTGESGGLPAGHYRFIVTALNDVGESAASAPSTDLVINANDVIEVTWDKVVGARAYKVFAAYNASANPGTDLNNYWLQTAQTSATQKVLRVLPRDDAGDGVGQQTFKLWFDINTDSNQVAAEWSDSTLWGWNPPDADRSKFFYLRAGANTTAARNPSGDKFNVDEEGFWTFRVSDVAGDPFHINYASSTSIGSLFKITDTNAGLDYVDWSPSNGGAFTFGNTLGLASIVLRGTGGGEDLTISGGTGSAIPNLDVATGAVNIEGWQLSNGQLENINTGLNRWRSNVAPGDADGAFLLDTNTSFGSADPVLRIRTNTEKWAVFGDGTTRADGNYEFQSGTGNLGTLDHAITAARTWTLPDASTTLVGTDTADTLSNKTLSSPSISGGVAADGGGFKHARVSTGSIAAGASAAVTLTWPTAFPDANYTATCSLIEATASTSTLRIHHLEAVTATAVTVRVVNDDGGNARTGTLHCLAVHD